jgi:TonB family protein
MLRTFWLFLLIPVFCASGFALSQSSDKAKSLPNLSARERRAWTIPHQSEFSDLSRVIARWRCEDTRPPQALTTPDPLLGSAVDGNNVKVTFIIGTDGRVHSPLILQSAGAVGDRNVLRTVRAWRYRPATCNGIPTEAEGDIEFSRR